MAYPSLNDMRRGLEWWKNELKEIHKWGEIYEDIFQGFLKLLADSSDSLKSGWLPGDKRKCEKEDCIRETDHGGTTKDGYKYLCEIHWNDEV